MSPPPGIVYLVGAGPGDPGLITVRGLTALREAEVVVADRLADPRLLLEAPPNVERIDVGKKPGHAPVPQEQINALIVDRARRGLRVVRLKGGDPFIFGRGFEELSACREAGIACVVVPGVSSAIAAPEIAGIPLTLRGVSRSFAVLTAETSPDTANPIDLSEVRGVDTLVILMGRARLEEISRSLVQSGCDRQTPVCCVQQAATPNQRVVSGTLATIARLADEAELAAPMVAVIGEVARFANPTRFDVQPSKRGIAAGKAGGGLAGRTVLVTRPKAAAGRLAARLTQKGAVAIVCPLLGIQIPRENPSLDAAIARLEEYNWMAFTSAHAVTAFWRRLAAGGFDGRHLAGCKLAALGFATARALQRRGLLADVIAPSAEDLGAGIIARSAGTRIRLLWPRGDRALPTLSDRLSAAGAAVEALTSYSTGPRRPSRSALDQLRRGVDAVVVYSPSAAEQLAALELPLAHAMIVCIGNTTAAAAKAAGLPVEAIASKPSDEGVLAALERLWESKVTA